MWAVASGKRTGGVQPEGLTEPAILDPHARFIVLVDSPASALERAAADGARSDAVLARWCESGRSLLRLAHRRSASCLFIDAAEAWSAQHSLTEALSRWDSTVDWTLLRWPPVPQRDIVALALAESLVSGDPSAQRVFAELHASCVVLPGLASQPPEVRVRRSDALEQYHRLLNGIAVDAQAAASERQQLLATIEGLQSDSDLLRLQLEQAQEELDSAYDRLAQSGASRHPAISAHAKAMRVLEAVDSPPHRHLHVDLRQVQLGARHWPSLEVRLLEHRGHPGLGFFAAGSDPEVVSVWQTSGDENGRSFMLIIPSDDAGRLLLARLGTSDWRTVRGTVDVLVHHLRHAESSSAASWLVVASRLQSQLDVMAPRLRYDKAQVHADPSNPGWLQVSFAEVDYGGRSLGDVHWLWQPTRGELRWMAPASGIAAPLGSWPAVGDGTLQPELVLPSTKRMNAVATRNWWAALSDHERQLVLGLLDALLGAVRQLAPEAASGVPPASGIAQAAEALHRDARRALLQLRLRSTARRLVRRGAATGE